MKCGGCNGGEGNKCNPLKTEKTVVIEEDSFESLFKDKVFTLKELIDTFGPDDGSYCSDENGKFAGFVLNPTFNWIIRKNKDGLNLYPIKKE